MFDTLEPSDVSKEFEIKEEDVCLHQHSEDSPLHGPYLIHELLTIEKTNWGLKES